MAATPLAKFTWKATLLIAGMTLNLLSFSLIDSLVLRPLPYRQPEKLFVLESNDQGEVEKYLISIGSSIATLKRQIKGELSWSRLLSRNVRPSANVSDDEVNAIIERI